MMWVLFSDASCTLAWLSGKQSHNWERFLVGFCASAVSHIIFSLFGFTVIDHNQNRLLEIKALSLTLTYLFNGHRFGKIMSEAASFVLLLPVNLYTLIYLTFSLRPTCTAAVFDGEKLVIQALRVWITMLLQPNPVRKHRGLFILDLIWMKSIGHSCFYSLLLYEFHYNHLIIPHFFTFI